MRTENERRNRARAVSDLVDRAEERITKDKISYPLFALQRAGAAGLQTEQEFLDACESLHHRHFAHPLKSFADIRVGWLKMVRFANDEELSLSSDVAVYQCLKLFSPGSAPERGCKDSQERESTALLLAVVDRLKVGVKPLKALQEAKADELDTNDMLLELRADLIKFRGTDPFDAIKETIPERNFLEFLVAARLQGIDLSDELRLLDLLADRSSTITPVTSEAVFREPAMRSIADEIRDSICRKINELIKGGDDLKGRMMLGFQQVEAEFNQWSQRCEEYLRDSLNEEAVKLFRSPANVPPYQNPIGVVSATILSQQWNPQRHLYERIASRVIRLHEILNRCENGGLC